jgi:peroxiredoxin
VPSGTPGPHATQLATTPTAIHTRIETGFAENDMAKTPSTMVPLGTTAPSFRLPDTDGHLVSLQDFRDFKALLVIFMCNHCPFVQHLRAALAQFAREYEATGLAIVGINSNDVASYPADRPEKMAEERKKFGYPFPYLYDETQEVAKAYRAACTPDFFLYDADRRLAYRGQFDDSRPGDGKPITGADLRAATDAVLARKPVAEEQRPSIGCNIKWKTGNAPDYAAA